MTPVRALKPDKSPYQGCYLSDKAAGCNDVANVYFTNLPPQLTGNLGVAAVNDKSKRKRLGKLLPGFRDATLPHGFDGARAYEVKDGQ
jgi:hypothetical protein